MSSGSYPSLFGVWSRTSSMVFESIVEANRAAIASMGASAREAAEDDDHEQTEEPVEERIEPGGNLPEWDVVFHGDEEALDVGDRICFTKTLTEADVDRFAAASGDTNPIHLDEEWASETRFGGRIVHGILASGLISAALARLPGSVIYLSQDVEFRASGLQTDYRDRLGGLETETLLVHGASDPLLPASWSRRAAESLPNGEVRVYDRTGHWPPREHPERFNADVSAFLS